jgi:hypothetical protein
MMPRLMLISNYHPQLRRLFLKRRRLSSTIGLKMTEITTKKTGSKIMLVMLMAIIMLSPLQAQARTVHHHHHHHHHHHRHHHYHHAH